ncbi:hypothetical protein J6590_009113 [Homalodisca vitripennis]|nr:hypothetical protein J6590_009113 [Homalodisca vitripennis]
MNQTVYFSASNLESMTPAEKCIVLKELPPQWPFIWRTPDNFIGSLPDPDLNPLTRFQNNKQIRAFSALIVMKNVSQELVEVLIYFRFKAEPQEPAAGPGDPGGPGDPATPALPLPFPTDTARKWLRQRQLALTVHYTNKRRRVIEQCSCSNYSHSAGSHSTEWSIGKTTLQFTSSSYINRLTTSELNRVGTDALFHPPHTGVCDLSVSSYSPVLELLRLSTHSVRTNTCPGVVHLCPFHHRIVEVSGVIVLSSAKPHINPEDL